MAVVEIGTWSVRSGYTGDIACTRVLPALSCSAAADETDFISIIHSAATTTAHSSAGLTANGAGSEHSHHSDATITSLWSLRALQSAGCLHMRHLYTIKRGLLGCAESDPLMLVVPEVWHERADVMEGLFGMILEAPDLTTALYCCRPSVCWALASGRTSAVVLDVGHSHTTVAAVLDGYALRHTVDSCAIGGAAVTAQLDGMLGSTISTAARTGVGHRCPAGEEARRCLREDWMSDVKHSYGYVSHSGRSQPPSATVPMQTPDGTRLHLSPDQRSLPYEVFFGQQVGVSSTTTTAAGSFNVAAMMIACKNRIDPEWQLHTVQHLVAGAGGLAHGFVERLRQEARERDAAYFRYERDGAVAAARSADGAWAGAAMAASSSSFEPLWVTRSEWLEEGASCLYRKLLS